MHYGMHVLQCIAPVVFLVFRCLCVSWFVLFDKHIGLLVLRHNKTPCCILHLHAT